MTLFGCRACRAKDAEIAHLLAELTQVHNHLERANARLCELAAPGSNARVMAVDPEATEKRRTAMQEAIERKESLISRRQAAAPTEENFPGYERPEPRDRYEVS